MYSEPARPMRISYTDSGVSSEFVLMTAGDFRPRSVTPAPASSRSTSTRQASKQVLQSTSNYRTGSANTNMGPPSRSAAPSMAREMAKTSIPRPSPQASQPSLDDNPMFFAAPDDDAAWDPTHDDEYDEMLGWNANGGIDNVATCRLCLT